MRLLVIHVSDLHIRGEYDDPTLFRAGFVARAALGNNVGVDCVLIIATGDFVDKGNATKFDDASLFLDDLTKSLKDFQSSITIGGLVVIPGNHDVVRPTDEDELLLRKTAIEGLLKESSTVDPDSHFVRLALRSQNSYFEFDKAITGRNIPDVKSRLAWTFSFDIKGMEVEVMAVNTAWMCLGDNDENNLLAWIPEIEAKRDGVIRIVAMHHPFSWLKSENKRPIQRAVVSYADLVLSGHEHNGQDFVRHADGTPDTIFFEGDSLGEPGWKGGFATLLIDFDSHERQTQTFLWDPSSQQYAPSSPRPWVGLRRGIGTVDGLTTEEEFQEKLDYPGFVATANGKAVRLDDVFVWPRLIDESFQGQTSVETSRSASGPKQHSGQEAKLEKVPGSAKSSIEENSVDPLIGSAEALGRMDVHPRMIISGDGWSGKSTLLRKYFNELRKLGFIPVLMSPKDFHNRSLDAIANHVYKRVEEQYGVGASSTYKNLPFSKRAILVDDIQEFKRPSDFLEILTSIEKLSARSILVGDTLQGLRQVFAAVQDPTILAYKNYRIRELDYRQQKELAIKVRSALATTSSEDEGYLIAQFEKNLKEILGDGFILPFPGHLVTILLDLARERHDGAEFGAYGFYYDRLIKNDLAEGMKALPREAGSPVADTLQAFLVEVAAIMFAKGTKYVSESEIDQLEKRFFEQRIPIQKKELLKVLYEARMFAPSIEGYAFRQPYQRYFYIAVKLKEMLGEDDTRNQARAVLMKLVDEIDRKESAEVLLFVLYMTKNEWLLSQMLAKAQNVLFEEPVCDMDQDFEYDDDGRLKLQRRKAYKAAHSGVNSTPPVLYAGTHEDDPSHLSLREEIVNLSVSEHDNELDAIIPTESDDIPSGLISDSCTQDQDFLVTETMRKMNEAFNTMTIIGQAVRNYPTRIKSELRHELLEATYSLSLRALSVFLGLVQEEKKELESLAVRHLHVSGRESVKSIDPKDLERVTTRLVSVCGFGIVRRLTLAVASPHISLMLQPVAEERPEVSYKLLRTSVMLDLRKNSSSEVEELYKSMENNPVAKRILAGIVANHLRTFRATEQRREALCRAVRIDPRNPALFYNPNRPKAIGQR